MRKSTSEGAPKSSEGEEEIEKAQEINLPMDIPPVKEVEINKEYDMEPILPPTSPTLMRSTRQRKQTPYFRFDKEHGYKKLSNYLRLMKKKLRRCDENLYRDN